MERFDDLPLPLALALLSALLVLGIWIAEYLGIWLLLAATIAAVALLAGLYVYSYSQRPHAGPPTPPPAEEEPFEDPVEEADRLSSQGPPERAVPSTGNSPGPTGAPDPTSGRGPAGNDSE